MIRQDVLSSIWVGGLLSSLKLYPFMYRGGCTDFNNATEVGYYNVSSSSSLNIPKGAYGYGTLLVCGDSFITQLYITDFYGKIYKRNKAGNEWRNWFEFTGTEIQV